MLSLKKVPVRLSVRHFVFVSPSLVSTNFYFASCLCPPDMTFLSVCLSFPVFVYLSSSTSPQSVFFCVLHFLASGAMVATWFCLSDEDVKKRIGENLPSFGMKSERRRSSAPVTMVTQVIHV